MNENECYEWMKIVCWDELLRQYFILKNGNDNSEFLSSFLEFLIEFTNQASDDSLFDLFFIR